MSEEGDLDVARFGIEVETFFNGPIGSFIFDMAEKRRGEAIEAFKKVNVAKSEEIQEIQNKLVVPDLIIGWMQEAIAAGHAAHQNILEKEQNDF